MMIPVVLVRTESLQPVFEADTIEDAQHYADEFNRIEGERPTGYIAVVDRYRVCTKNAPSKPEKLI